MFSSQQRYHAQPVNSESHSEDAPQGADTADLDSDAEDAGFLTPPDENAHLSRRLGGSSKLRRSRGGFCSRLSKPCIFFSLLLFSAVIALITSSGVWVYKSAPPYGQSPPWYPTPKGGTVKSWEDSYRKAKAMVEKMTLPEKVNITTGTGWAMGLCVGNTAPAVSVGFPPLCLQDGPLGLRFADHSTSFPAGITVGATWNRDLMRLRGAAHGREARLKGVNVLLGPAMGPLGRHPAGGRTWEGFGADPVLQAVAAAQTIRGIQSEGVIATAKHWVGNEQEHFRKSYEWGLPEALSSNIDDRTLHEIYAWPFAESVRAGVASVMCSYQLLNNSYACGNSKLLNGILKDELGFQGFVQSDWLAQRSGVASALAGLDMTMPGDGVHWQNGHSLFGSELTLAVLNGSAPLDRLNDMASRVVAAWYQLGQDSWSSDGPNFSSWTNDRKGKVHQAARDSDEISEVNSFLDVRSNHSIIARQVAAEGAVLVKNEDGTLPLERSPVRADGKPYRVMVVGEDAGLGRGPNACPDRSCNQGTLAVGWGSGASEFSYLVDPWSALEHAFGNATVNALLDNKISEHFRVELEAQDLCIVFANSDAGEGYLQWDGVRGDRNDLNLQKHGDELIINVADRCRNVVVVVHAVGPVVVERWADLPNVKAILLANLPGQESGNALVDVLFGDVDASGRLPYTVGKKLDDYGPGAGLLYNPNGIVPQANFEEGLYIDYRHFDKHMIEPRYPFGYGLSYASFEVSDLVITGLKDKSALPEGRLSGLKSPEYDSAIPDPASALFPEGFRKLHNYIYPYISSINEVKSGKYTYPDGYDVVQPPSAAGGGEGGNPSLFEDQVQIDVQVKNTGSRPGKVVVQVYVAYPNGTVEPSTGEAIDFPVKVLRNFEKAEINTGASKVVSMKLTRKDVSYWSVVQQNWVMPDGEFRISVGFSSRDLPLEGIY